MPLKLIGGNILHCEPSILLFDLNDISDSSVESSRISEDFSGSGCSLGFSGWISGLLLGGSMRGGIGLQKIFFHGFDRGAILNNCSGQS